VTLRRTAIAVVVLAAIAVAAYWYWVRSQSGPSGTVTVYYTKLDASTMVPWTVSLGPARDRQSVAFYAVAQAIAGPPRTVEAIRFPAGTVVRHVRIVGSTATVDLANVGPNPGGSLGESGEFKSLVWTLTALPGIDSVQVTIEGQTVASVPGGHFELDQPLRRSDF
jgi:spore germination protein GerM